MNKEEHRAIWYLIQADEPVKQYELNTFFNDKRLYFTRRLIDEKIIKRVEDKFELNYDECAKRILKNNPTKKHIQSVNAVLHTPIFKNAGKQNLLLGKVIKLPSPFSTIIYCFENLGTALSNDSKMKEIESKIGDATEVSASMQSQSLQKMLNGKANIPFDLEPITKKDIKILTKGVKAYFDHKANTSPIINLALDSI